MSKEDTKAQLTALRKQHGEVLSREIDGVLYAFRSPTLEEYEDYQTRRMDEKPGDTAGVCYRHLAQQCCITDLGNLQALFKRKPGVPQRIANGLCEMAGATLEFTVGKD
jgi:hypothetical protein